MDRRGHRLRFTAVSVLVVLALTGFSTGRGHRGGSHGGDGGGGCSSSGQDHDGSSSGGGTSGSRYHDYDDDDDTTTTGGGGSTAQTPTQTPTGQDVADVRLVRCATADNPKARLDVRNYNATDGTFSVHVAFEDAEGVTVDERTMDVKVAARNWAVVEVPLEPAVAAKVEHCEAEPVAPSA
ncbi:hypothetical protein ACFV0T_17400 [Streptomyces sp. NPDC059582]|uniref:hypothetical protein n=1 Tax=Streptomyces sp. NPDC059582 TaxID=3346875 RepID=UPI0036C69F05